MELVASSLNCPTKPFCIPFTEARSITKIKMAHPTEKPVKKVLSLLVLSVLNISCQTSRSNILFCPYLFYLFVLDDNAVLKVHNAFAHVRYVLLVGDHQNGISLVIDLLDQIHDLI